VRIELARLIASILSRLVALLPWELPDYHDCLLTSRFWHSSAGLRLGVGPAGIKPRFPLPRLRLRNTRSPLSRDQP